MDSKYDIIDVAEDMSKGLYNIGVFSCKVFYHVSSIDALKSGMDSYNAARFKQRLEYFIHDHSTLSKDEKQKFYNDLKTNSQNLDYLYEFIEKTRCSMYDLHARFLSRLSVELVKNNGLNYYQSTLLANINILNDIDLMKIHSEFSKYEQLCSQVHVFEIENYQEYCTFQKCIQLGFFEYKEQQQSNMLAIDVLVMAPPPEPLVKSRHFTCNEFTMKLYEILDEIVLEAK